MSLSFSYVPNLLEDTQIGTGCPSRLNESLRKVFGDGPWVLDVGDLDALEAMAAVWSDHDEGNPFRKIIKAIEQYTSITLRAQ